MEQQYSRISQVSDTLKLLNKQESWRNRGSPMDREVQCGKTMIECPVNGVPRLLSMAVERGIYTMLPINRGLNLLIVLSLLCFRANGQDSIAQPSRNKIVSRLRHQEDLVRSAYAEYEYRMNPTPPDAIPILKRFLHEKGEDTKIKSYIITSDFANMNTYDASWWRKDVRERIDGKYHTSDDKGNVKAFSRAYDDKVVRELWAIGGNREGVIETVEGMHWNTNKLKPLSLIIEYGNTPYSTIMANGNNYSLSTVERDGARYIEVSVDHPTIERRRFRLLFDDNNRLIERYIYNAFRSDPALRLIEKHEMRDYRHIKDANGNTIWMPFNSVWHYYQGSLRDGTLVSNGSETLTIKRIELNIDIPDELFRIKFPFGARINDYGK